MTGFHLDEYVGLAISHPASFRGYLWQRFVSQLPLPLRAFHFLDGEGDPQKECSRVADIIRRHPIDVAFVGIGENGHLAFNDPPADFETEQPYFVVQLDDACRRQQLGEGWFPTFDDVPKQAISMSVRQIMKSRAIICTVPDERKAEAVQNSVEGEVTPKVPASILQRHEQCTLYLDKPAASKAAKIGRLATYYGRRGVRTKRLNNIFIGRPFSPEGRRFGHLSWQVAADCTEFARHLVARTNERSSVGCDNLPANPRARANKRFWRARSLAGCATRPFGRPSDSDSSRRRTRILPFWAAACRTTPITWRSTHRYRSYLSPMPSRSC